MQEIIVIRAISTLTTLSSHETMLNFAQNIKILSMIFVPVLNQPKLNQRGHF